MRLSKRTKKLAEDDKYLVTRKGNVITTLNKKTGGKFSVEIKKKGEQ